MRVSRVTNDCWLLLLDTDVAVMNSATIKDLKPFVEKKVNEMEQSNMKHEAIAIFSWYFSFFFF
ncbi:putative SNRNP25, ubiquitin-like domain-containing protein [Helianthus debilis subsp. tardiflorus]